MEIPVFSLHRGESQLWREALADAGAVRFTKVGSPEEIKRLQDAAGALSDRLVRENIRQINGIPLKYGARPDGTAYIQRCAFSSLYSEAIASFVRDERFEAIRRLCGDKARLGDLEKDGVVLNCYRNEPGSRYKALGWHTDGLRDVFYGRLPGPMYNVGYYVDDSPAAKGSLRFLPGSHRQGLWSMATRKLYFLDHRPDPGEVLLEAEAGDVTIHDGRLWHRVGQATVTGDASLRRTFYVPYLTGPYEPKNADSPTPFYHRFQFLTG